ncbi:MAG: hypothetical protein ABGZ53_21030 [Fuerstiella sp.]
MDTKPTTEELRQRLRERRLERVRELAEERIRQGENREEAMRKAWLALWDDARGRVRVGFADGDNDE